MKSRTPWHTLLWLVPAFFWLPGCNAPLSGNGKQIPADTVPRPAALMDVPGSFTNQRIRRFDSTELPLFFRRFPGLKAFAPEIRRFYRDRQYACAWHDEAGLIETADQLSDRIQHLPEEGILTPVPYYDTLRNWLDENDTREEAMLDIMLTSQYLSYAHLAWKGLPEAQFRQISWLLPRKKLTVRQLLDSLTTTNTLTHEPVYRQYALLKEQLKRLKVIRDAGHLPRISTGKRPLKPGDTGQAVLTVRKWLHIMGDLPAGSESTVFDSTLHKAVIRFQQRVGLKPDGFISRTLADEMNVPLDKRIETILVNMERCRWVPQQLQRQFILVNIPDYRLYVLEKDSLVMSMKVVVGKSQNKTVVFTGKLQYIVFSPYWNVPASILRKEILPAIRRNRHYLAVNHMEWHGKSVRQLPGADNALGRVKFLFPNSHSIYLHDTPSKSLFESPSRAFSHGCIRIAEPRKLAVYLLRDDPEWPDSCIDQAMNRSSELTVTLSKPVPVYITYFTAWVSRDGQLQFRKDVYRRDEQLASLILEKKGL